MWHRYPELKVDIQKINHHRYFTLADKLYPLRYQEASLVAALAASQRSRTDLCYIRIQQCTSI